MVSGNMFHI